MQTAEVLNTDDGQTVKLPSGFHFKGNRVSIHREGDAVVLQPVKPVKWPIGFFDSIRIDDPAFVRPEQGRTPVAPSLVIARSTYRSTNSSQPGSPGFPQSGLGPSFTAGP